MVFKLLRHSLWLCSLPPLHDHNRRKIICVSRCIMCCSYNAHCRLSYFYLGCVEGKMTRKTACSSFKERLILTTRAESCPGWEGWQHTCILTYYNFIIYLLTSGTNTSVPGLTSILIFISLPPILTTSKTNFNGCVEELENMPQENKPKRLKRQAQKSSGTIKLYVNLYDLGGTDNLGFKYIHMWPHR